VRPPTPGEAAGTLERIGAERFQPTVRAAVGAVTPGG
jgi:hypothetical protein